MEVGVEGEGRGGEKDQQSIQKVTGKERKKKQKKWDKQDKTRGLNIINEL